MRHSAFTSWFFIHGRWAHMTLICLCGLSGCSNNTPGRDYALIKTLGRAPDFMLTDLGHQRFYLNSQRGKPVILTFWFTTCSVCKREMADLQRLGARHSDNLLSIAAICTDPENKNAAAGIAIEMGLSYPILLDEGSTVASRYSVKKFPYTVIIDQRGDVIYARGGYDPVVLRDIEKHIERLMTAKARK